MANDYTIEKLPVYHLHDFYTDYVHELHLFTEDDWNNLSCEAYAYANNQVIVNDCFNSQSLINCYSG